MPRSCTYHLVALFCLLGAVLAPSIGFAEPFKCSICHRKVVTGSVVHKPVAKAACLDCHQQFSNDHPLGKGSMGFIVPKEKLCGVCHGSLLTKKFLHGPVGKGECSACHLPHSGENKSLLRDPAPALCFRCHPKDHFDGAHGHPPVAKGECLSCHDAHQSEGKGLLRKEGSALCFSCHDGKIAVGKSLHKPVGEGKCVDCHAPHASAWKKLLKADYPNVLYRPFSGDAFPLCFSCHDPALASETTTEKSTNFRNGTRNLHSVHVNKVGKGRSCRMCHNPHASAQDRLVYPKAPGFGTWDIPIRFQTTSTGGSCSVGCHRTFKYDRVNAVVN
ncbi:cytochrome c3 family protein [Geomonas sp. RF6]|uniref:cytochrome c3 family protein n=1 Tax=Geomonas sp. RF6 TaxID=2897342 RepID=UPI001E57F34E|nr:cytochrome c3 family protein [Geomonas sp. RF6]UFS72690.1 cytochrome c3 family protein [Geomonas sp. RF6]